MKKQLLGCSILVLLLTPVAKLSAAQQVEHTISYPPGREQYIKVRSRFPVNAPSTELIMPEWTPGSYLIRDFAANVDWIKAVSGTGGVLDAQKISKDRWRVDTRGVATLSVDYLVHTPDLNVRSSWASQAFTLINGASVFLYTEATRETGQSVSINVPAGRGDIYTPLPVAADGHGFIAGNYDELVDNPLVVASAPARHFRVNDQEYAFLNVGENHFWDGEQAVIDLEKIVGSEQKFWGINPLDRTYWFFNFAVQARGGLEHDNSTVVMTGRHQMRVRDDYIKWLSVMSHEFFHVWNVRHMRPAGLTPIDYQREQYTPQLWLAEGLTSYYGDLLLSRARLISPAEYMELLARDIHRLETMPGRKLRPVTEASLDTWIRYYHPNANTINSNVSYYTKGAVIGFVLDAFIRKTSRGHRSLDDVMRKMYRLYADKPYATGAFTQVVAQIGGSQSAEFLTPLLETTAEPDVDAALEWYGLQLDRDLVENSGETDTEPPASGFGIKWSTDIPGLVVKSVLAGSSGAMAGILPGDELLAIGNERVSARTLKDMWRVFRPGEKTTVLLARRGRITTLKIVMGKAFPEQFEIDAGPAFNTRHVKRLHALLGQNLKVAD